MKQVLRHPLVERLRSILFGSRAEHGILFKGMLYALLITIGFVYIQPLLFMFVNSIKSPDDLLNPMVQWVPTQLYLGNYEKAYRVLAYPDTLLSSILMSVMPSVLQTAVASVVGYGLARYRFLGKRLIFVLLLATFLIPPQNTVIPQMLTYRNLGLLGDPLALIIPAIFGQGFRSAIFILIFYQSFSSYPRVLEESARLDGATDLRIFFIALPSAIPAFIVSFIFSTVWYWNETFLTVIFLEGGVTTLPMQLSRFTQAYENLYPPGTVNIFDRLNEAVKMSGTFLNILPLLVMYFVLQHWFVESVEMTGITGE
ncbi:MAG: carbohydrate ABC transporter permease [Anaerolineae bacterium]|nr:carbohydrate ABC transporter permease [Anaerolineae bacterium]MCB9460596.1 carbohydrate ABC transporter permease [Anaerolineaceae bacterium]